GGEARRAPASAGARGGRKAPEACRAEGSPTAAKGPAAPFRAQADPDPARALAVAGLVFPALFHGLHPEAGAALPEQALSRAVAVILALTYGCSLLFSLRTHKAL